MKVLHVVPSVETEASGPSYSVPALCHALVGAGHDVHLHVLGSTPVATGTGLAVHVHPWARPLHALGFSAEMRAALRREATTGGADIVHTHSLWMMPNVYPAWAVRGTPCRLMTAPRGTLSEWALRRRPLAKRLMWLAGQGRALRASDCFHATAPSELADIRRHGLRGPVAVLPNGVDIPHLDPTDDAPRARPLRLLFMGRIHAVKGIDALVRAWAQVAAEFPNWEVVVTGPDGGALAGLQALAAELGVTRLAFSGPAYGAAKSEQYRTADLFVLPSHSENFGLVVAEALAHGIPAIVTHGAPWSGLAEHDCGWWIPHGVDPLVACLRGALALPPPELRRRGLRGRAWMERDYGWESIGARMSETYRWMRHGGAAPAWVDTDRASRPTDTGK